MPFVWQGQSSLIDAVNLRKDEVYKTLVSELSFSQLEQEELIVKYHKSCDESYVSTHNLKRFVNQYGPQVGNETTLSDYKQII